MERFYREKMQSDNVYRIRFTESIIEQLKKDFSDLNGLMEKLKIGRIKRSELDEILQKISWIKQGLKSFNKMKYGHIEGVLSGGVKDIEKNMREIENNIKMTKTAVSKEKLITHLR